MSTTTIAAPRAPFDRTLLLVVPATARDNPVTADKVLVYRDTEIIGNALIVHNYGHGGSGWSLSWGSGTIAVRKAMAASPKRIAVIGCGALGLTSAILAQTAGAAVTIYAKDHLPEARSFRATGTWSPDSRIALADAVAPDFPVLLVARVVQASGTAIMFPLLMTIVMTLVLPARRGTVMGHISIVVSVACSG